MDLARDEETRVRNLGRLALEKAAKAGASKAGSNGISRTFATVSRVNGDGTIDVSMGDYTDVNGVTSECILRGLRMTVACSGAQVGDRVIVDTYAHVSVVTGILANADNTHYVNYGPVYPNSSLPESWYEVRSGIVIVHAASYDQVTAGSGNNGTLLWTMPEWLRPRRSVVAGGTRLADGVAQLSILNSGDVRVFGFMSNVTYWGVTTCYAVTP